MKKVLFKDRGLTEKVTSEEKPKGGGSFGDTGASVLDRGNRQGTGPEEGAAGGQYN